MFTFGTNDYGTRRCIHGHGYQCDCYCETSAWDDGTCDQVDHNGFRLYKFVEKGNDLCVVYNIEYIIIIIIIIILFVPMLYINLYSISCM